MRYVVVGTSGVGKSTFAKRLANLFDSSYIELDALHWAENWTPRPNAVFEKSVRKAAEDDRWVADGNYSAVRQILWPRATHILWLNFNRRVIFPRIVWRTLRRTVTRETLWNGNRESFRTSFFSRDSILLWSFNTFGKNRVIYAKLREENKYDHLKWIELDTPKQAEAFLRTHRNFSI